MKKNYMLPFMLSSVAAAFMVSALKAGQSATKPADGGAQSHAPSAAEMEEKNDSVEIKAALKPLRDKLKTDRASYVAAFKSGNKNKLDATKATVSDDIKAIYKKKTELLKKSSK